MCAAWKRRGPRHADQLFDGQHWEEGRGRAPQRGSTFRNPHARFVAHHGGGHARQMACARGRPGPRRRRHRRDRDRQGDHGGGGHRARTARARGHRACEGQPAHRAPDPRRWRTTLARGRRSLARSAAVDGSERQSSRQATLPQRASPHCAGPTPKVNGAHRVLARAAPRPRRGLDLPPSEGSGPRGRIVKADIAQAPRTHTPDESPR